MSERVKLSQHTAILLERARRFAISDDILLSAAATGDVSALQPASAEHYEYGDFVSYAAEHGEQLERAIREGYRMTFNTNNGLKAWLRERFGVEQEKDYEADLGLISGLKLQTADVQALRETVAANWVVETTQAPGENGIINVNIRVGTFE